MLREVKRVLKSNKQRFDIAFWGCGINDVWRQFQGRTSEAVLADEFETNCREGLHLLIDKSRHVTCISETPFSLQNSDQMNDTLSDYNRITRDVSRELGVDYVDVFTPFVTAAMALRGWQEDSAQRVNLWSDDGVHLSDIGDTLLAERVLEYLQDTELIDRLQTYQRVERHEALVHYHEFLNDYFGPANEDSSSMESRAV